MALPLPWQVGIALQLPLRVLLLPLAMLLVSMRVVVRPPPPLLLLLLLLLLPRVQQRRHVEVGAAQRAGAGTALALQPAAQARHVQHMATRKLLARLRWQQRNVGE